MTRGYVQQENRKTCAWLAQRAAGGAVCNNCSIACYKQEFHMRNLAITVMVAALTLGIQFDAAAAEPQQKSPVRQNLVDDGGFEKGSWNGLARGKVGYKETRGLRRQGSGRMCEIVRQGLFGAADMVFRIRARGPKGSGIGIRCNAFSRNGRHVRGIGFPWLKLKPEYTEFTIHFSLQDHATYRFHLWCDARSVPQDKFVDVDDFHVAVLAYDEMPFTMEEVKAEEAPPAPKVEGTLLAQANQLVEKKFFAQAAGRFEEAIQEMGDRKDGQLADIFLKLAPCYEAAGRPVSAGATYERFLAAFPDHEKAPEALYLRGRTYEAEGKFAQAISEYNNYLAKHPDGARSKELILYLPELYEATVRDYQGAANALKKAIEKYPDDPQTANRQEKTGRLFLSAGKYELAAQELMRCLERHPDYERASVVARDLAKMADETLRDAPTAVAAHATLLKLKPKDAYRNRNRDRARWLLNQEVKDHLQRAGLYRRLFDATGEGYDLYCAAENYHSAQKQEEANRLFRLFFDTVPGDGHALHCFTRLVEPLVREKKKAEAIKLGESLRAKTKGLPSEGAVTWWMGHCHERLGDRAKALALKQAAMDLGYWHNEGECLHVCDLYVAEKKPKEAEAYLRAALSKTTHRELHMSGAHRLAAFLIERKDFAGARKLLFEELDKYSHAERGRVCNVLNRIAEVATKEGNPLGVVPKLEEFIKQAPYDERRIHAKHVVARLFKTVATQAGGKAKAGADAAEKLAKKAAELAKALPQPPKPQPAVQKPESPQPPKEALEKARADGAAKAAAALKQGGEALAKLAEQIKRQETLVQNLQKSGITDKAAVASANVQAMRGAIQAAVKAATDGSAKAKAEIEAAQARAKEHAAKADAASKEANARKQTLQKYRQQRDLINRLRQDINKNYDELEKAYGAMIKEFGAAFDVTWHKTELVRHINRKDHERARKKVEELIKETPLATFCRVAGYLWRDYDPRDYKKSIDYFKKTHQIDVNYDAWGIGNTVRDIYLRRFKPPDRKGFVEYGVWWLDSHPRAHINYRMDMALDVARTLRDLGRHPEALKVYKSMLVEYPNKNDPSYIEYHPWTRWMRSAVHEVLWVAGEDGFKAHLDFIKRNPNCPDLPNFIDQLVRYYEQRGEYGKVLEVRERLWNNYKRVSGGQSLIVDALLKADEATEKKLTAEVAKRLGGTNDTRYENLIFRQARRDLEGADPVRRAQYYEDLARRTRGSYVGFQAKMRLAQTLLAQGRFLDAAVEEQKTIYYGRRDDKYCWERIVWLGKQKMARHRMEEAGAIYRTLLATFSGYDQKQRDALTLTMNRAFAQTKTVFIVDAKLPYARFLRAAFIAERGDHAAAFQAYERNKKLFDNYLDRLPADYVGLVGRMLTLNRRYKESLSILRGYLRRRGGGPNEMALIQSLIADNYFQNERYQLARLEYETVAKDPRFASYQKVIDARFRIGECYMMQKAFDKASETFDELARSRDEHIAIRGDFMKGVLLSEMGERDEALTQFLRVMEVRPTADMANVTLFRLGELYLGSKKYKTAEEVLSLVGANRRRSVSPNRSLRVVLRDVDLAISKGAKSVPVVVRVIGPDGKERDREERNLFPVKSGGTVYMASLPVVLGEPTSNDQVLQVSGDDRITYDFAEVIKKTYEAGKFQPPLIGIASDAALKVSATEVAEEGTAEALSRLALMRMHRGEDEALSEEERERRKHYGRRRDEKAIRPGNNLYVQVTDPDMDRSAERDALTVTARASSGDQASVELKETEPHSGVFFGVVPTGMRPPDALASDNSKEHGPLLAIDADTKTDWIGAKDSARPKWLTVDMKELYPVKKIVWRRGPGAKNRGLTRYRILGGKRRRELSEIVRFPQDPPLLTLTTYNRTFGVGHRDINKEREAVANARVTFGQGRADDLNVQENPFGPQDSFISYCRGNVFFPKTGKYVLAAMADDFCDLYLDGKFIVRGPQGRWEKAEIEVTEGVHYIEVFHTEGSGGQYFKVAWQVPGAKDIVEIPKEAFNPDLHPELRQSIRALGTVEPLEGEIGATITLRKPYLTRFAKFIIEDYDVASDAPAISEISIFDAQGQQIVPTDADILSLALNKILEMSPGDDVVIRYDDKRRLTSDEGEVLEETLSASFFDGYIQGVAYTYHEDLRSRRQWVVPHIRRRFTSGERFIVRITDPDEDVSDKRDSINFTVTTASGKTAQLRATETEALSGEFTKEVDTSPTPKQKRLLVKPGEELVCSYVDELNTDPGMKTERKWTLVAKTPSRAKVRIIETRMEKDARGNKRAKTIPTEDSEGKEIKYVSPDVPLIVEIVDPDQAESLADEIHVDLNTSVGKDTQELTLGIPRKWRDASAFLDKGAFRGSMALRLGDKDSPDHLVRALWFDEAGRERYTKEEIEKRHLTPVLNVMGGDVITVTYMDDDPDNPGKKIAVTDKARIVADAEIESFYNDYKTPQESVHVGDKIFLRVTDADADRTAERDKIEVRIVSNLPDEETITLEETLSHTGEFTGSVRIHYSTEGHTGDGRAEADFGNEIHILYLDTVNSEGPSPVERKLVLPIVMGSDGLVLAFGKKYRDDEIAVESLFKVAESYFELFKMHNELRKEEKDEGARERLKALARKELAEGREISRLISELYPENKIRDRVALLLANFHQELEEYDHAIIAYRSIVNEFPDSSIAPQAQYKLAQCFEKKQQFQIACDEYVRLAYEYPSSVLVGDSMIRIASYFEKNQKDYKTAIDIYGKLVERFPYHKLAERVFMKIGQCHYLDKSYKSAAEHFEEFLLTYPKSKLKPMAMYWAARAYFESDDLRKSYRLFKRVVWEFPESVEAKYARGALTDARFEREAIEDHR